MHEIADIACNFTSERFDKDLDIVIDTAITNKITNNINKIRRRNRIIC